MDRVHTVVFYLQPIAVQGVAWARTDPVPWHLEHVEDGKFRVLIGRPHVGKDQATILVRRVSAMEDAVLEGALGRLAGGFQDRAVHVEQPAVVAAADAPLGYQAELE